MDTTQQQKTILEKQHLISTYKCLLDIAQCQEKIENEYTKELKEKIQILEHDMCYSINTAESLSGSSVLEMDSSETPFGNYIYPENNIVQTFQEESQGFDTLHIAEAEVIPLATFESSVISNFEPNIISSFGATSNIPVSIGSSTSMENMYGSSGMSVFGDISNIPLESTENIHEYGMISSFGDDFLNDIGYFDSNTETSKSNVLNTIPELSHTSDIQEENESNGMSVFGTTSNMPLLSTENTYAATMIPSFGDDIDYFDSTTRASTSNVLNTIPELSLTPDIHEEIIMMSNVRDTSNIPKSTCTITREILNDSTTVVSRSNVLNTIPELSPK